MSMSLQVNVTDLLEVTKVEVTEVTARLQRLQGQKLNANIGRAVARLFVDYIGKLPANKHFPEATTGENAKAARSVSSHADDGAAVVTVGRVNFRERVEGGVIKPGPGKKYLTIPARAEAYGKVAGKFNNLRLVFRRINGVVRAVALEEAPHSVWSRQKKETKKERFKRLGISIDSKTGEVSLESAQDRAHGAERGGLVMYWLVPSVVQKGNRSIIPSDEKVAAEVMRIVEMAFARENQRGGAN